MGSRWNHCFSTSQRNISCKFQNPLFGSLFSFFFLQNPPANFHCRIVGSCNYRHIRSWTLDFSPLGDLESQGTSTFFHKRAGWGVYSVSMHAFGISRYFLYHHEPRNKPCWLVDLWGSIGVCYLTKHGVTKAMIQVAISTHDSFFCGLSRCLRKTLPTSALLQKTPLVASNHFHHLNR